MIRSETQRHAAACAEAADRSADVDGFVAVRRLVEHFGADLIAQPLLYEGMIAAPKSDKAKWLVLVDSLESGFSSQKYNDECAANALPPRLRFTIAHELGHLLQFKSSGSPPKSGTTQSRKDEIDSLEREADTLSPLLLISESAFEKRLAVGTEPLTLRQILEAKAKWGVSREVLVNRFNLLSKYDPKGLRLRAPLQNLGLGLCVWSKDRQAMLVNWPKPFCNFAENLVPAFLRENRPGKAMALNTLFPDPAFILNGGKNDSAVATLGGGTPANPQIEKMTVRLTVEPVPPAINRTFIVLVQRIG